MLNFFNRQNLILHIKSNKFRNYAQNLISLLFSNSHIYKYKKYYSELNISKKEQNKKDKIQIYGKSLSFTKQQTLLFWVKRVKCRL